MKTQTIKFDETQRSDLKAVINDIIEIKGSKKKFGALVERGFKLGVDGYETWVYPPDSKKRTSLAFNKCDLIAAVNEALKDEQSRKYAPMFWQIVYDVDKNSLEIESDRQICQAYFELEKSKRIFENINWDDEKFQDEFVDEVEKFANLYESLPLDSFKIFDPKDLLKHLQNKYTKERVEKMSLDEYCSDFFKDLEVVYSYKFTKNFEESELYSYCSEFSYRAFFSYKYLFEIYSIKDGGKVYKSGKAGGFSSDGNYAWNPKFGKSADEAFTNIRSALIEIVESAKKGDLAAIEQIDFIRETKWRIAFIFQNLNDMKIPCVFTNGNVGAKFCQEFTEGKTFGFEAMISKSKKYFTKVHKGGEHT